MTNNNPSKLLNLDSVRRIKRTMRRRHWVIGAACLLTGIFGTRWMIGVAADRSEAAERILLAPEQGGRPEMSERVTPAPTPHQPTTVGQSIRIVAEGLDAQGRLQMVAHKAVLLPTLFPYKRVAVSRPEIADVNMIGPTSILVTAKTVGAAQLVVWDDYDNSHVMDLVVASDLSQLNDLFKKHLPSAQIEATGTANGTVVLRGKVSDLTAAEQATALAAPFGEVLNLLEVVGGQQVMLQVRFMEVSRTAVSALGVDIGMSAGNGDYSVGLNSTPGRLSTSDRAFSLSGSGTFGEFAFEAFIDALKRNSLARVLAEPNLTVTSGEEGKFLAGGQVPIPVPQAGGGGSTITIEYKDFGVGLKCTPVVLGDGRVRMRIATEVSELDYSNGTSIQGEVVPGLKTRNVNTVVEMADGQTFMLGGLLNRKVDSRNQSTPLLGEIPILGSLFRSVRYERSETELVILVTPRLVQAMNPGQVPLLPGEKWRYPNEAELFFNGDIGGPAQANAPVTIGKSDAAARKDDPNAPAPRFQGAHGFVEDATAGVNQD